MRQKGFTLTELIIVILVLITAFFFMVSPGLLHKHEPHNILQCGSQLKAIGTAIALYQNDFDDWNPVMGYGSQKGFFGTGLYNKAGETKITRWVDPEFDDWDNQSTVGGCLYLLIKYEEMVPKSFVTIRI